VCGTADTDFFTVERDGDDIGPNAGFGDVGIDHDTAAFAAASIRGWWRFEGRQIYPEAKTILITADADGSNGWRLRLWKLELQKFADQTGLCISLCHFPPGTSKWNKIEHRLFPFLSSNGRGEPLRDYETIVHLIARTILAEGLKVTCRSDRRKYPTGREVSAEEMKWVNLEPNQFSWRMEPCHQAENPKDRLIPLFIYTC